jgi:hypothetical protein
VTTDPLSIELTRRTVLPRLFAAVAMGGLSLIALAGCESMPAASSAKTVHVLAALRTAISVKSLTRVEEVRQRVEELEAQQELNDHEVKTLQRIIGLAAAEDWKAAEQLCHRFQKAQIR